MVHVTLMDINAGFPVENEVAETQQSLWDPLEPIFRKCYFRELAFGPWFCSAVYLDL